MLAGHTKIHQTIKEENVRNATEQKHLHHINFIRCSTKIYRTIQFCGLTTTKCSKKTWRPRDDCGVIFFFQKVNI